MLLYKPKKDYKTIRKLSKNYLLFHYFCFVDKDNNVTGYSLSPLALFAPAKGLLEEDIQLLGKKRWEKLDENTTLVIYAGVNPVHLEQPVCLEKPVRGMRYATDEEERILKETIVKQEIKRLHVTTSDGFYGNDNYQELYRYCLSNELQDALFTLEQKGELL